MKALVFEEHGGLEQLQFRQRPRPEIGPDDVLLSVRAAALNRLDLWVVEGWPSLKLPLPHILGSDGAGVVAEVGANVTEFAVGDRVAVNPTLSCGRCTYCRTGREQMCDAFAILGEHAPGFYAEYAAVPARNLLRLPAEIPFTTAAAASLVFVTAWHSLIVAGRLRAGEDVLVVGAGGGVNSASIQIARLAGARTIYVVGSSDEKLAQARALGADVVYNRNDVDWSKAVFKDSERRGVDVVVDNVGAATFARSLRALARGGRLLTVGNTSGARFEFDNRYMFGKHLSIIGSTMGNQVAYETVMGLIFDGRLRPVIDTIYPFDEALTALRRMENGDVTGKLVLEL